MRLSLMRLSLMGRAVRTAVVLAAAHLAVTQPAPGAAEPVMTRIAFGSCVHQDWPQPIWRAVLDYRPELFVFAGDNVYGDVSSAAMTELNRAYASARRNEGFQAIRQRVPVLAIWDDHDYGRNDGGADFAYKVRAKSLFLDFWGAARTDPRRARAGIYHAARFGPPGKAVQVILLDTRTFRSTLRPTDVPGATGKESYLPDPSPGKSLLGTAQWAWLRARLREPADLRLIVSSIQVLADGHGFERWGNLPGERRRLIDAIATTGAKGVVLLSGDRHVGALYRRADGTPYPFYEITSSGLNMTYPDNREPGPHRLGAVYGAENFGTIEVDWWRGDVTLAVRNLIGDPVRQVVVPLATLAAP